MDEQIQPAFDIYSYIEGFNYSIKNNRTELEQTGGFTKPYRAGRLAGHKQVQLLNLLNVPE